MPLAADITSLVQLVIRLGSSALQHRLRGVTEVLEISLLHHVINILQAVY